MYTHPDSCPETPAFKKRQALDEKKFPSEHKTDHPGSST
jgi:hypothetical protein